MTYIQCRLEQIRVPRRNESIICVEESDERLYCPSELVDSFLLPVELLQPLSNHSVDQNIEELWRQGAALFYTP